MVWVGEVNWVHENRVVNISLCQETPCRSCGVTSLTCSPWQIFYQSVQGFWTPHIFTIFHWLGCSPLQNNGVSITMMTREPPSTQLSWLFWVSKLDVLRVFDFHRSVRFCDAARKPETTVVNMFYVFFLILGHIAVLRRCGLLLQADTPALAWVSRAAIRAQPVQKLSCPVIAKLWQVNNVLWTKIGDVWNPEIQWQGSHKPGKPGIVREFCKPEKVREFEIWSGNFLWRVTWFATCLSMSW